MSDINKLSETHKKLTDLLQKLENLIKQREQRSMHISAQLNNRIDKLESEIHRLTLQHRQEIKEFYSGSRPKQT